MEIDALISRPRYSRLTPEDVDRHLCIIETEALLTEALDPATAESAFENRPGVSSEPGEVQQPNVGVH